MDKTSDLIAALTEPIELWLAGANFYRERLAFRKDVGDVRWYISLENHLRAGKGEIQITCTVEVFSEPLARKSPALPEHLWAPGAGQIRVNLKWLAGFKPGGPLSGLWQCRSFDEATRAGSEILNLLSRAGLPFLEQYESTDDMIPRLRSGQLCYASKARTNYDADVWEGKIDPTTAPWKSQAQPRKVFRPGDDFVAHLQAKLSAREEPGEDSP